MILLSVPNVSEGRDAGAVERFGAAFETGGVELLDTHTDGVHNRSVFTLAGEPDRLRTGLHEGARAAIASIDMTEHEGAHPCIGALDVAPVVWLSEDGAEPAREEARLVAAGLAELGLPVFYYGDLASSPERRERAFFRRGGLPALRRRMSEGLVPDLGPAEPHASAGAVLVTARAPIAAFNMRLASEDGEAARLIASQLREEGGGPAGLRAIGIEMRDGTVQVSTNVHDPISLHLAEVVERTRSLAHPHGVEVTAAEIVGLVPSATLEDFPADLPIEGFDPERHVIEARIAALG